jgi:hypothetical protein
LNPLVTSTSSSLANGNLDLIKSGNSYTTAYGTIKFPSSGKWYFEVTAANNQNIIGIDSTTANADSYPGTVGSYGYYGNGNKIYGPGGIQAAYGASFTTGDVIGVALDITAGTLVFYKNGVSQGTAFTGLSGEYFPSVHSYTSGTTTVANFGQRAFAYPLSGFKALCTTNLPAPLVTKPNTVMDVKLYTGNGGTQTISGLGFSPDLVWMKIRNKAYDHRLIDVVRGGNKTLYSSLTNAEATETDTITAFNSDGWTMGGNIGINESSSTFAAWTWDAGTTTVSNTQGSITSQCRTSVSSGFSIVTYTGNGTSGATVGHGLGVAPSLILVKCRSNAAGWLVYHSSLGATQYLALESTAAAASYSGAWNNTAPTSTLFSVGNDNSVNTSARTYVAYCFAPVVGYSSFGSYVGNNNPNGPFIYTGFRPRFILIKNISEVKNWLIYDTARDSYNVGQSYLAPNLSNAEATITTSIDILSNGFKLRYDDGSFNGTGTQIYAAFAESPFQYARAR